MKAALLLGLLLGAPPWSAPPSVAPQWVGDARPAPGVAVERVVTVSPSATEILFALGLEERVVGVSRFDDRPPRVKELPKVGGFTDPNVESIVALRPDLVVAAANAENRPALEAVSKLGIPVYAVPGNTFADVFAATRGLAEILGPEVEAEAESVLSRLRRQVEALEARDTKDRLRVLVVFARAPLIVAGPGSLADSALDLLGVKNVAEGARRAYPHYSPEMLVAARPDVIVDATGAHGAQQPAPWAGLDVVPAVKRGRVVSLDLAVLLRPSPRFVEGVKALDAALRAE